MSIITIAHEAFGDGRAVAERVASILNYRCISREVLIKAYHEIPESMIIINPPTEGNSNSDDGIALIDLSLPHLDTAARAKFEITQKHQGMIFSDLVNRSALPGAGARISLREKPKTRRDDQTCCQRKMRGLIR